MSVIYLSPPHSLSINTKRFWYDEAHSHILYCRNAAEQEQDENKWGLFQVKCLTLPPHDQNVTLSHPPKPLLWFQKQDEFLCIKMSLDCELLALQRSDIEISIVSLRNDGIPHTTTAQTETILACKPKPRNRIITDGIIWGEVGHPSRDLYLITTFGIEHHKVTLINQRTVIKPSRIIAYKIHNFWYAAKFRLLLISTGELGKELRPYCLSDAVPIIKLQKVVVPNTVSPQDCKLVEIYQDPYIALMNSKLREIHLYSVTQKATIMVKKLVLQFPETLLDFAVVDNLFVCHSSSFGVCQFYDIVQNNQSEVLVEPYLCPLPIGISELDTTTAEGVKLDVANLVFKESSSIVEVCSLMVNLKELHRCSSHRQDIVPFLLRRCNGREASNVIFNHLQVMMTQKAALSQVSNALQCIQNATADRKLYEDFYSVSKFMQNVWIPAASTTSDIDKQHLAAYLCEYVKTLPITNNCSSTEELYMLLATLYVDLSKFVELHQLIMYRILQDSEVLATALLYKFSESYQQFEQVALDMLHRLQKFDLIITYLLTKPLDLHTAMKLTLRNCTVVSTNIEFSKMYFECLCEILKKSENDDDLESAYGESKLVALYSFYIRWGLEHQLQYIIDNEAKQQPSLLASSVTCEFPHFAISESKSEDFQKKFGFMI